MLLLSGVEFLLLRCLPAEGGRVAGGETLPELERDMLAPLRLLLVGLGVGSEAGFLRGQGEPEHDHKPTIILLGTCRTCRWVQM